MKLLILTRFPPEYEPQRLAQSAKYKGIKPEIINYQDIEFSKSKLFLPQGLELEDFDFVIPRSAAHRHKKSFLREKMALIKALPRRTRCLNKEAYLSWPKLGKIRQAEVLKENNLPTIPTLDKPIFPAILKAEFGSHSKRVIRVENQPQIEQAKKSYSGNWFYQPLIKTPVYWRVIVLGNQSLGIMERKTNERFVNSEEGKGPEVDQNEIESLALKATKVFKVEFAGVDLLADKKRLMVIEVNRSPQFRVYDKLCKVNVADKIVNYLTSTSN
ncbi:MAG TPA: hypothetical protein VMY36_00940 [Patescibacteria group bacterium]|nr:hypothetical protein [Patescibacteria group bacterium]